MACPWPQRDKLEPRRRSKAIEANGERIANGASRRESGNTATLGELLNIEGVVAAGEFTPDGNVVDFQTKIGMPPEVAEMMTQSLAIIIAMFNNLASSSTPLSERQRISRRGWAYSVDDWALVIGSNKGVLVETAKADFDTLSEALDGSEHCP